MVGMRAWLTISASLVVSLFALQASANGTGLKEKSGKDGQTCAQCHNGGVAPTVTLDGPPSLAAGASADYTLTIKTTLAKASAGIATDTGKLTAGPGLKLDGTELTHSAAIDATGGEAKFTFKVKAPASGTKVKLWAAGLASDGTATGGDADAKTTLDITITGGSGGGATAAGEDETPSGGKSSKKSSSSSGSGDNDDDDSSTGIPNSGCASAPERTDAMSGLAVLAALAIVLKASRRRDT